LSHLREKGITPEQVWATADKLREDERKRGQIARPSASNEAVGKAVSSAAPLVRISRVLDRLADELASGRTGPTYSLVPEGTHLVAQGRRPWPFHRRRLLVLDGTANPEILKQFVPPLVSGPEIRVERNARVIQMTNATFYRSSLIRRVTTASGKGEAEPTERLVEVGDFIERTAGEGRTLVVTNKPVRCALTGEDERSSLPIGTQYRGADVAHFGNLRGSNEFEEHDAVIILGRDEPSVRDAEQRAMAIWYDTKKPMRRISPDLNGRVNYGNRDRAYTMRDGSKEYAPPRRYACHLNWLPASRLAPRAAGWSAATLCIGTKSRLMYRRGWSACWGTAEELGQVQGRRRPKWTVTEF